MPAIGEKAPDFIATTQSGEPFQLSSLRGQKVVLFFYPKADTPTCTTEACSFRDSYAEIRARSAIVVGVSPDTVTAQAAFHDKHHLPYLLVADADHRVSDLYGVWGTHQVRREDGTEVTYTGVLRTTFIIDEQGVVQRVFPNVDVREHTAEVLSALEQ
ncbi:MULTISPECIES: peroxiredoxin [Roseiflexus]|uniref:thioredoxin-dependent peroxiredoxin n=1 Tax=Roseiflexus castenholzii (strain DSM 13941 / HLO8) TaxID=383372 RepID=A7NPR8_ROSCS|nr:MULTISPECIES: peroxiredoxin [Roseiflexus]ABU59564.1 alkyl hydroperoxide reductase/ Thiol specific antioxidant/ Mal allergen [Roseiflexus castenholzii DSM 13941]GIW02666.1 MAG: peroxiredoxin [Roseiflexus sp.]